MNDSFVTALNVQKATARWVDVITDNLANCYTPGFKETQVSFQTFLDGAVLDNPNKKFSQGKSTPGTSNSNLFSEGNAFFVVLPI